MPAMIDLLALTASVTSTVPSAQPDGPNGSDGRAASAARTDIAIDPHKAALLLMEAGQLYEADRLLSALAAMQPQDEQTQFLLALISIEWKDYPEAIRRLRAISAHEPDNVRVRLELGRVYFLQGDYLNADRQFRFARAGQLPPAVNANIELYLRQIRLLKRFSYSFGVAIAPDSNLNAAPSMDTISLYGIPFELDEGARRKSGVGLALQGTVEQAFKVAPKVRVRLGGQLNRLQYGDSQFNDMTIATYVGPRISLKYWDIDLAATGQRRWYGERAYMDGYGARMSVARYVSGKVILYSTLSLTKQDYARNNFQDGTAYAVGLGVAHTPTPSSLWQGSLGFVRQTARVAAFASRSTQFNVSHTRELRGGLAVSLSPSMSLINYDRPLLAFGRVRRDRQASISVSVVNRRIDFRGLTPRLSYTYTANLSNIGLYRLRRQRIEIGLTRVF